MDEVTALPLHGGAFFMLVYFRGNYDTGVSPLGYIIMV
nr:MAG TPA: hypothetical protein [Caudoviricetes sp.]